MTEPSGVLVLHKPAGMTSHDCVSRVRRLFQTKKVGHIGTLDPDVTGVLPICIGKATRIVEYLQDLPKAYEAVLRLGMSTTTEDAGGEAVEVSQVDASAITAERVLSLFEQFTGEIEQVPPMYSAVKVNGQRLHQLARQGQVVERASRKVTVYQLLLHHIAYADAIDISFYCRCSKGTYIRTLCVDLGAALGYPAHMARLIRVESGSFRLEQAVTLDSLETLCQSGEDLTGVLVSIDEALSFLPRCEVPEHRRKAVLNGLETALPGAEYAEGTLIRLYAGEALLGIHRVCMGPRGPFAKAEKVFQS
ncbi:tRNA pseudouridine(55) synthase TruB [Brevibacillus sp. B_LB10_24]|uniref:tRNA pseudouridine(55) synthase TruB n=1 Tax=Brevibacillus sp. B_LB10_24 TaxID=3380645 RepID=UPI0038BA7D57